VTKITKQTKNVFTSIVLPSDQKIT